MNSKSLFNRLMKRPNEASGKRQHKSRHIVHICDGAGEEAEVSLMTPPMKLNKRPREDGGTNTPRKSSFGAVRVKDNECEETNIFRFRVLLPNGTSVELKMSELRKEITIEEFRDKLRKEYSLLVNQKPSLGQKRRINWEYNDLHFTDTHTNKIRIKLDFRQYLPSNWNLLWLHDGELEHNEYEDMWDLTPDTDLLKELPDDYTCETALADLIDNSLQALWSNGAQERRLISVEMEAGKISIFDSGPGMDGANESIVKWGKMGASLHRSVREKAIGGEPPYLMPLFGMFGYGGPVATMCLGRRAVVSSKTKESSKVYTLHMEREALVSASHKENCWKTKGGVRDPLKDEKINSPHGSFTKVEIFDPKPKVKNLYIRHLRRKLKDIYFPYIQCDEMSGKTSRPIEFQVNGIDLAEIQGGEVAITNLHSCNGPDFVLQLKFSITPDSSSMAGQNQRVSATANARLKCVYFPVIKGEENIKRILDRLDEDQCGIRESFESFSRVSVRRLGRLLPDTRWGLLPFMEPKQKKGEKAHSLKRLCSRVKCFIDTDSGFNPTPHKTDLAHHHPFTKALKSFGYSSPEDEKEVQVEISRDGKKLTLSQIEKLYHEWISEMHNRYDDEETDCGLDNPTIVIVSSKIKKLDLTADVLRVHKVIQRKGRRWEAGMNIKVLKGACTGCHSNNVYATLEYMILEGLQGDASGEARLICRPLGLPENRGCRLSVGEGNSIIVINDSYVFPIRIIDSDKCLPVDDTEWETKLEAFKQKLPAAIDLLSHSDCQELMIDGGLPKSLEAGHRLPENIVAVVRPNSYSNGNSSKRLDQKFIVRDNLEMILKIVKCRASDSDVGNHAHVYSARLPASSHKELHGLYIFPLSTTEHLLFEDPGIFMFTFSLKGFKDIQLKHELQVRAPAGIGRWEVLDRHKSESYTVRVGSCFKPPLSIICRDGNKKRIQFTSIPNLVIKLISCSKTLAQVRSKNVEITPDKLTMKIKDISFKSSELDDIRPNYEAMLHISTPDEAFSVALPCRVMPATLKKITVHPSELQKQVRPGQIIEELSLEVFDEFGNHLKENEIVLLRLDGLTIGDGSGVARGAVMESKKKVDANGHIDLSNALKVSKGYGKRVSLRVISKDEVVFELHFDTEIRELRAVHKHVFMNCEAGSLLENVTFEVVDSDGVVDESFHDEDKRGQSHTLSIKCKSFRIDESAQYSFRYGRCTVPSIPLPPTEGVVFFHAVHSRYPELKFSIKVNVDKTWPEIRDSVMYDGDEGNFIHPAKSLSESEPIPRSGSSDVLQSQVAAEVSQKLTDSALISQMVHLEKQQQEKLSSTMNHEDVGNPMLSTPRSSECGRIHSVSPSLRASRILDETSSPLSSGNTIISSPSLSGNRQNLPLISPSLRASQVMNETFSPHSSENPILSTPRSSKCKKNLPFSPSLRASEVLDETFSPRSSRNPLQPTPRSSEHRQILPVSPSFRGSHVMNETLSPKGLNGSVAISDSPSLKTPKFEHKDAQSGSSVMLSCKENPSEQELVDGVANWAMQAASHQRNLESLEFRLLQIQQEISQLRAVTAPDLGKKALSLCCLSSTLGQIIKSRSQSAAAVICKMLEEDLRRQGIVGVVALLGTVESTELSRMLAQYLGEDQMLAIVCGNYNALRKFNTDLGLSTNGGYNAVCLDDIRPRSKEPSTDPREPLPLQDPTLPNGNVPRGFLGYAVNLISIEPNHLHWRTTSGHDLRETLFYRLFGKLQVYKDGDCMMAAQSCIKAGAVSLDGGILRGNGLISLGHWESKILFPVMNKATSPEILNTLAVKEVELAKIQQRRDVEEDAYQRSAEKFVIYRDKYKSYVSQRGES